MTALIGHQRTALRLPGDWDSRSLTMPTGASIADFEHAWQSLDGADDSIRFWKGDLINQARERWGEEAEAQLYGPERANNHDNDKSYARVAERIPANLRSETMSWSAHKALAGIDTTLERTQFVQFAQAQGWKSKECEVRVAAYKGGDKRFCDPDVDWEVLDAANKARREKSKAGSRGPVPRVVDNSSESELPDDDTPVMDAGAFGESLSAERAEEGYGGVADGFDQISKIAGQIGRLNPDLRHRLWRMCINADDASVIHELFPQSPSHVEPSVTPAKAPCEAPATVSPAVSTPRAATVVGGALSGPGFDQNGETIPPSYIQEKEAV